MSGAKCKLAPNSWAKNEPNCCHAKVRVKCVSNRRRGFGDCENPRYLDRYYESAKKYQVHISIARTKTTRPKKEKLAGRRVISSIHLFVLFTVAPPRLYPCAAKPTPKGNQATAPAINPDSITSVSAKIISPLQISEEWGHGRYWPKPAVRTSLACCQTGLVAMRSDWP